ncbi:hypothetical protein L227DRAFT_402802 [Lentinus tigrinus ALCF2SS1-6]|uniref:Uncharacterized protein n=1 Tax=Lentinus tigrinus ALCF2SS1-6 TaxID=1328759 RepID=A0A5C2RS43_9APHY|nr:hypothetical protein L227DRAFT_402802 [Lentinus tigrinus ALCF2SS1-6]
MGLLRKRTKLRYVHLTFPDALREEMKAALQSDPPPSVELLGYGMNMHWVTRDPARRKAVRLSPYWPYRTVFLRSVDDFGDEDWEWLSRHHGTEDGEAGIRTASPLQGKVPSSHDTVAHSTEVCQSACTEHYARFTKRISLHYDMSRSCADVLSFL